jgi:hypothetical protein
MFGFKLVQKMSLVRFAWGIIFSAHTLDCTELMSVAKEAALVKTGAVKGFATWQVRQARAKTSR